MTFYQAACFFIIYAFLGWCLEVAFCSINTGKFVNRGFLNGPLCPIYGFGGTLVILLLTPFQNNIVLLFVGSVVVTSLLELVTGFVLKKLFHTSWWDYSDQRFNIGGYICLKFSLAWGLACVLLMKLLHPLIAGFVAIIPGWLGITLLSVLYALLLADAIVTVTAIAKLNRDLGEITRLAENLHKGSDSMAENIGNTAIALAQKIEKLDLEGQKTRITEKLDEQKERLETAVQQQKEKISLAADESREKMEALFAQKSPVRKRLFKAFPNMQSGRYNDALQKMRLSLQQLTTKAKKEPVDAENEDIVMPEDTTD